MLSPIGYYLTNSSVCEIMQSCFQICFETRLTELLRKTAESMLVDMVQLLFARMPQFKEEFKYSAVKKVNVHYLINFFTLILIEFKFIKKLSMKGDTNRQKKTKKQKSPETVKKSTSQQLQQQQEQDQPTVTEVSESKQNEENGDLDLVSKSEIDQLTQSNTKVSEISVQPVERTVSESSLGSVTRLNEPIAKLTNEQNDNKINQETIHFKVDDDLALLVVDQNSSTCTQDIQPTTSESTTEGQVESEYVNPRGVRFVQDGPNGYNAASVPYGLPCLRELLRFLISLVSSKNSEIMISMGLNLITIGLESSVDHIASYQSLLAYVKDDLCKNLYNLLSSERLGVYANTLRVSFLLFESLRSHLKLQMEHFFIKLMDIIVSDSNRVSKEQKEMTIDFLLQLLRLPGFPTELYLNYDCSLNCTNLFEDLTKLLSKVI